MAERDTYTKVHEDWKNRPDETTPVYAEDLEHMEQGISNAMDNRARRDIYDDDGIRLAIVRAEGTNESDSNVIDIVAVDAGGAETHIYKVDREGNVSVSGDVTNGEGTSLNDLLTRINNISGGIAEVPVAAVDTLGGVKPDGTTITIDADGTIHAVSSQELAESILGGES